MEIKTLLVKNGISEPHQLKRLALKRFTTWRCLSIQKLSLKIFPSQNFNYFIASSRLISRMYSKTAKL